MASSWARVWGSGPRSRPARSAALRQDGAAFLNPSTVEAKASSPFDAADHAPPPWRQRCKLVDLLGKMGAVGDEASGDVQPPTGEEDGSGVREGVGEEWFAALDA